MVRKARMTVIVSAVVAAVTCGSTLNAARDATPEARANRNPQSQSAPSRPLQVDGSCHTARAPDSR